MPGLSVIGRGHYAHDTVTHVHTRCWQYTTAAIVAALCRVLDAAGGAAGSVRSDRYSIACHGGYRRPGAGRLRRRAAELPHLAVLATSPIRRGITGMGLVARTVHAMRRGLPDLRAWGEGRAV